MNLDQYLVLHNGPQLLNVFLLNSFRVIREVKYFEEPRVVDFIENDYKKSEEP